MKALRIAAMVVALTGAGAWDEALPFTLLGLAAIALLAAQLLTEHATRRQRVTQLRRRLVQAQTATAVEPEFSVMAETLTQLAATISFVPETARPSGEIIYLDDYRKNDGRKPGRDGADETPAAAELPIPAAVEMQRRLAERVGGLRQRQELLPRYVGSPVRKDAN